MAFEDTDAFMRVRHAVWLEMLFMTPREIFNDEHDLFRANFAKFLNKEVIPFYDEWEQRGYVDRDIWRKAGSMGFLCPTMPEAYGGAGVDRLYSAIVLEELALANVTGLGFGIHSDIVAPYILNYGSDSLKEIWLPKLAEGETIAALGMTEPGTGSDLQRITTTAVEDGDDYIINGSKIFITNGYLCGLVLVAAKTGDPKGGADQLSVILVEADRDGFTAETPLRKLGMKAQDTSVLHFSDVRVPKSNLIGNGADAFKLMMHELPWERLMIAVSNVASARAAFREALDYSRERVAFGKVVGEFQNTRFKLAEMKTEIEIAQVFVDHCLALELEKRLDPVQASMAKYHVSEVFGRVADEGVQIHGGYGYMLEYPITRLYAEARVQRIYGGTTEIMKEIIARSL